MVMPDYLKRISVFIASPRDLNAERKIFRDAIEKVNTIKAKSRGVLFEAVGWEDTLLGKSRPQEKINGDLKKSHLIVMLLWKRWGSPTGEYSSGFEEEYEIACTQKKDIWLYFRDISDDILEDPGEQVKRVIEFRKKIENERKFLFKKYKDEDEWKDQFIEDLCRWLDDTNISDFEKFVEERKILQQPKPSAVKGKARIILRDRGGRSSMEMIPNHIASTINPRIYDEKKLPQIGSTQLPSYKWDAQNFEGFWYDLKTGSTGETLEIGGQLGNSLTAPIDHNMRILPKNTLVYLTVKQVKTLKVYQNNKANVDITNAFGDPASYNVVGLQAQPYVAIKNKANKLSKLIIEQGSATSEKKSLTVGETWDIGDGWTLTAQSIDAKASPRQVWLVLSKDGTKLDDKVIAQGQSYVYTEKNFAGEIDVPLFVTYVDSVFAGATSDMVQLRYTWAISKSVTEVKINDKFGKMDVVETSVNYLIFSNKDTAIGLLEGSTVDIMGSLKFKVADDPNFLRFHPIVL